jgi:hypothetical protein
MRARTAAIITGLLGLINVPGAIYGNKTSIVACGFCVALAYVHFLRHRRGE